MKPSSYRDQLKENTTCPDCGKELTQHGLKYTHKKYCKNKPVEEVPEEQVKQNTQPVESAGNVIPEEQVINTDNTMSRVGIKDNVIPTNQQIADFLSNQRKTRHIVKREQMSSLIKKALPQQ